MEQDSIIANRLETMGLGEKKFSSIDKLLETMGAIQCQDLTAGKWALGIRLQKTSLEKIHQALATENVVRTHVLRPTLHFVRKEDIRWMLNLTAPKIRKIMDGPFKRKGITEEVTSKTRKSIQNLLEGKKEVSSNEIQEQIAKEHKITLTGIPLQLVLMDAELDKLICSGLNMVDQQTYALFDERIPQKQTLSRKEALEELTKKFFTGHGPATMQDCARWTGLTMGDIKKGVNEIQERKELKIHEKDGYLYINDLLETKISPKKILLPRFDEYINGYKDKTVFLPDYDNTKANELNYNAVLDTGKIIGKWTRKTSKKKIELNFEYFTEPDESDKEAIEEKTLEYAGFMQKPLQ